MVDDSELLRRYSREGSQEAFAELVRRHLGLVYHAALRRSAGDAHLAQEAAADVFVSLGRKAASLSRRPALAGWLYVSACHAAANLVRSARRRRLWETKASMMHETPDSGPESDAVRLRPVIDEVLLGLRERDREALLMRYFEGLRFGEMAVKLRLTEDGARLRVERALERTRRLLARKEIASTGAALTAALAAQTGAAAPDGMAVSVTAAALSELGANGGAGAFGSHLMRLMTQTKASSATVAAVALLSTGAIYCLNHFRSHDPVAGDRPKFETAAPWSVVPASGSGTPRRAPARVGGGTDRPTIDRAIPRPTAISGAASGSIGNDALSDLGRGIIHVSAIANLGRATPRTAMESFLWAIVKGSNDEIAGMLNLSASQEAKVSALLAALPDQARGEYPDAGHLVAVFAAYEGTGMPRSGDIVIKSEANPDSDDVVFDTTVGSFGLKNGPDGWKIVVPDYVIDRKIPEVLSKGLQPPAR